MVKAQQLTTKQRNMSNFLNVILGVSIFFFIISFSISLVIWSRSFFYGYLSNINLDNLSFKVGKLNYEQLKQAYDEVMNYLIGYKSIFSSGLLKTSQNAIDHFSDVKRLFIINFIFLAITSIIILTITIIKFKFKNLKIQFLLSGFIASITLLVFIFVTIIVSSINFEKSFAVFHKIFFPGKSNWIFNPREDEIIQILTLDYFKGCAIFIGVSIIAFTSGFIFSFLSFKVFRKFKK
ncbi:TIGR01906 family membrane protein [Mycoplasmopsis ciconiae]|uniref:TIGR01906 family membrane protein n=1 Tax=Mycoplasmopsis ciconiae TaxID=561067 RepID=A0ABU7ML73_9BACT|nr:TIGR01906 family membrane protein [Mycoplasmopsis ciconiae]